MTTMLQANEQANAILFLHAQTALHPGSGTALGVVDLPIQRERHTQWPVIPGSALKGVLRDACRRRGLDRADLQCIFGPETDRAHEHAGALSVTDARILLFPVRSLCGVFAWVTCPAVLTRFHRDLAVAGVASPLECLEEILELADQDEKAACPEKSPLLIGGENKLVLEEMEFARDRVFSAAPWLAERVSGDPSTRWRIGTHLAVISDNAFGHFAQHATEIAARISLTPGTKTVKNGALFYQEFLPAETVFYTLALANASRREGSDRKAADILSLLTETVARGSVLQIGGDETTGKGFCTVAWFPATQPRQIPEQPSIAFTEEKIV